MPQITKIILTILIILALGAIAKGFNEAHHEEMALKECGSKENIAHVDEDGFECKVAPPKK